MEVYQQDPELLTIEELYKKSLKCNPGFAKTTPKVIELIESYTNSKFLEGDYHGDWRKPFLNIVENPTLVASKMIDLDTKNVQVIAEDWQSKTGAYLMDRDLKFWMKGKGFGKLLNIGVYKAPKYGHLVWKKVGDEIFDVYLGNLMYDPEADSILKSYVLVEKHFYTKNELEKMPWDKTKIKAVINNYEKAKKTKIEVWEEYSSKGLVIKAGMDLGKEKIIELYTDPKAKISDYYKEYVFEKVEGRAMGRGQVEKLFESQIIQNESTGYLLRGLKWSSMHLWQTRDPNVKQNFLNDVDDGDIVTALSEINPVQMEERNLGVFKYIDTILSNSVQTRTFSQDVMRGDRPPAGTPLGTSQLQAVMAGGYFDLKREDYGMFVREVIVDWVIPGFKKRNRKAQKIHMAKLLGEAAGEKIFNSVVDTRTLERQGDLALKGKLIGGQELEMLKATIADSLKRENMSIPENFYDDINYKIDVVVTGEQIDLSGKITTAQVLLQLLFSNPQAMSDPMIKRIFNSIANWAGIPMDTFMNEETPGIQQMTQMAPQGGSISIPKPSTQPQMAQTQI